MNELALAPLTRGSRSNSVHFFVPLAKNDKVLCPEWFK